MVDEHGEVAPLAQSLMDCRSAARRALVGCLAERPELVPSLAKTALLGGNGKTMSVTEALADDVRTMLPLLLDHLLSLMGAVDSHFRMVERISCERALTMDLGEVRDILMRERRLMLPVVEIAEVMAGMLGETGDEPLRDILAYRACSRAVDGHRASRAVRAVVEVAMLVERGIAGEFPGRGIPKRPLLDEARLTELGPYIQLDGVEAERLRNASLRCFFTMPSEVPLRVAIVRGLNLSSVIVRELAEYDPEEMAGCSFLPESLADALARTGMFAELLWAGVTDGCEGYEKSLLLLGGVCGSGERHRMMTGKSTVVVEEPSSKFCQHVAEADLSMLLRDGSKALVLGPYGSDGDYECVSVWPIPSLVEKAASLVGSIAGETDAEEAAEHIERWWWLRTSRDAPVVTEGMVPLTDEHLRYLGVDVGDELTVAGCDDHAEIWNPARWDEATRDFEEELIKLLSEH